MVEEKKKNDKYRNLGPLGRFLSKIILGAIPVFCILYIIDVPTWLGLMVYKEQYLGLFLALFLSSTFLNIPPAKRSSRDRLPWYDAVLAFVPFVIFGYITLFYADLVLVAGFPSMGRSIMGFVAVLLIFEAARRVAGYPLVIIGGLLVLYARFAYLMPGLLNAKGVSWQRLFLSLYLDPNSLLGIPTGVAATMVVGFLFFGVCLFVVGGGEFLSSIAMSLMGRQRGGAAKVAVIAIGLFGSRARGQARITHLRREIGERHDHRDRTHDLADRSPVLDRHRPLPAVRRTASTAPSLACARRPGKREELHPVPRALRSAIFGDERAPIHSVVKRRSR